MDPGSSAFGLVRDDVREGGMAETTAGETGKDPAPPPRSPRPRASAEPGAIGCQSGGEDAPARTPRSACRPGFGAAEDRDPVTTGRADRAVTVPQGHRRPPERRRRLASRHHQPRRILDACLRRHDSRGGGNALPPRACRGRQWFPGRGFALPVMTADRGSGRAQRPDPTTELMTSDRNTRPHTKTPPGIPDGAACLDRRARGPLVTPADWPRSARRARRGHPWSPSPDP